MYSHSSKEMVIIKMTNSLHKACNVIDIKLVDHLIISDNGDYFSFKDEHPMKNRNPLGICL